jgi:ATP-dependent Clp protease ATP-binding subunit ClpB
MDDGRLTDGQGRTVDFTNVVLIMTSNLGSGGLERRADGTADVGNRDRAASAIGEADEAVVMAAVRNHFKPEFLNRIDETVVFHRLDESHIERIVEIQVEQLRTRLAERNLGLEITEAALAHLAKVGYDPDFGARPLKRVLQREVADPIALGLLKGDYGDGDVVAIDATSDGQLSFSRRAAVSA